MSFTASRAHFLSMEAKGLGIILGVKLSQTISDQAWSFFGKKFPQNSWQACSLFITFESDKSTHLA